MIRYQFLSGTPWSSRPVVVRASQALPFDTQDFVPPESMGVASGVAKITMLFGEPIEYAGD